MSYIKYKVCVVIPCFKVKSEILSVLNAINFKLVDKVFVVDDFCPENTGEYVKKLKFNKVEVLFLKKNLGVGGATIRGFKKALSLKYDLIFKIDGDGQHNPNDIKRFLKNFKNHNINFCKGTRFTRNSEKNKIPKLRYFGNKILTSLTKFNCKIDNLTDAVNGFLCIKSTLLKKIDLNKLNKGFFFEEDLLFYLSFADLKLKEIPIKTIYFDKSNLNPFKMVLPFIINHFKNLLIRFFN